MHENRETSEMPEENIVDRTAGEGESRTSRMHEAVVTILNQIYEEDFRGFSYGFRPGRSQHQALDALYVAVTRKKVNWVLSLIVFT